MLETIRWSHLALAVPAIIDCNCRTPFVGKLVVMFTRSQKRFNGAESRKVVYPGLMQIRSLKSFLPPSAFRGFSPPRAHFPSCFTPGPVNKEKKKALVAWIDAAIAQFVDADMILLWKYLRALCSQDGK